MKYLFDEVGSLDKKCYEQFYLTEDILMEHAAQGIADFIYKKFKINQSILIVSGSGNNGADGIALARILQEDFNIYLYIASEPKNDLAKLQLKRAKAVGVNIINNLTKTDIIVDSLFGTGLNKPLNEKSKKIIKELNSYDAIKIACDIPSGLEASGYVQDISFKADFTLTMGALKKSLFSDSAKNIVGKIKVINLGVSKKLYENKSNWQLLQKSDLKPPFRDKPNTHKGSFGHLNVLAGEKLGAGVLASLAAFRYGTSLVTLIHQNDNINIPYHIMHDYTLSKNATAIASGMGLGIHFQDDTLKKFLIDSKIPKVIDADLFYHPLIIKILKQKNIVLTPHPKEFVQLLKQIDLADIDIKTLQDNRFYYVELFAKKYPDIVLLLKGANMIISYKNQFYINPLGSNKLSKGGSGDILSGLIGSLLAQGYLAKDAAIQGSLALSVASNGYKKNNYAMTPNDIIKKLQTIY